MTEKKNGIIAEKITAILLSANRRIQFLCRDTRAGGWDRMIFHELSYGTVAIFGCPELGAEITKKLSGFGCKVLTSDRSEQLCDMAAQADYLINLDDKLALDANLFEKVKDGAIIVDAAGNSIEINAALEVLKTGRVSVIASCAADSKLDPQLNALKNYVAFPELWEEMRG